MEKRFFIEKESVINNFITLDGEENNHLSKVLRLKVGDKVECFYDSSDIFDCSIEDISKNSSTLKIVSTKKCEQNTKCNVTLFQGLPKLDKLEFITQKLTEIGIKKIVPFSSKFCIAKENLNKIERLNKIVVSACKQCGRTELLKIDTPKKFKEMIESLSHYDLVFFANECEMEKEISILNKFNTLDLKDKNIAYIIGSEGGFDKDEIDILKKQNNVISISLGKRILRTETASIVLGSLILGSMEEF